MTHDPDVRRLAELARLALTPEEERVMAEQLACIVAHMADLHRVNLADAPPPPRAEGGPAPLRDDRVEFEPLALPPDMLAPSWQDGLYRVPRLPALDPDASPGPGHGPG